MSAIDTVKKLLKKFNRFLYKTILGGEYDDIENAKRSTKYHHAKFRLPSFSKELLYQYYDKDSGVFFNKTNAGYLYRLTPLTGANEHLAEQLDALIRNKISEHHTIQVIKVVHNKVGEALDNCLSQFNQSGFSRLKVLGSHLAPYWRKAATDSFVTKNDVVAKLTDTEVYFVIDKEFDEDIDEEAIKADLGLLKRGLESSLTSAQIGHYQCNERDLLRLISFYTKPDSSNLYNKWPKYNESVPLNEQVTNADYGCDVEKDALFIDGVNQQQESVETVVSMLTLTEPPEQFALHMNGDLSNNIFEKHASINCNHIVSATFKVENQAKAQYKANRKTKSLNKKANSVYAKNVAGTTELAANWEEYRNRLSLKKTKSVKVLYNVVLFSKPEEQSLDVQSAKTTYAYSGIPLSSCKHQHGTYFLSSMPFMFSGYLEKDFSLPLMMWPVSSWNAVQMMPIIADWSGNKKGILLPTVRNQIAFLDPFSGVFGSGLNIAFTGITRAGKSFGCQAMLLNVLFNGGDVFIIDVGGSYKKLTKLLGGVYLEYSNLAVNPFTHVVNIHDEIDEITDLFSLLVLPKTGANEDDGSTLRQGILNAFELKGNETVVDDVQKELTNLFDKNPSIYPTAGILAKNLSPYCLDAEHGKAFNLPSKLDPNARFIVVDLKEISKKEKLKQPVLLSVFSQYRRRMFDSDRSKQKMCIIDEAWSFIASNPVAIEFIMSGFRTGSKHNCSFVTLTQGIEDYYRFESAKVLWENAALKLVFKQDSTSLADYHSQHDFLSDYEYQILRHFPKPEEVGYSEVLVKGDSISSFHRLFVDPFTLVSLSSKGEDYQAVEDLVNQGVELIDAISQVAKSHYGEMYV